MNIVRPEAWMSEQIDTAVKCAMATLANPETFVVAGLFVAAANDLDAQMSGISAVVTMGVTGAGELVSVEYNRGRTFTTLVGKLAQRQWISVDLDPSVGLHPWNRDDLDDVEALYGMADLHITAAEVPIGGPTAALASFLNGRDVDMYRRSQLVELQQERRLHTPVGRIGDEPLLNMNSMFQIVEQERRNGSR